MSLPRRLWRLARQTVRSHPDSAERIPSEEGARHAAERELDDFLGNTPPGGSPYRPPAAPPPQQSGGARVARSAGWEPGGAGVARRAVLARQRPVQRSEESAQLPHRSPPRSGYRGGPAAIAYFSNPHARSDPFLRGRARL